MEEKALLFNECKKYLDQKIRRISASMKDLELDLENETKSSAGDKYETGREMINAEWNKLSGQLAEFKKLEITLKMAMSAINSKTIRLGSLVKTNVANYFICIAAGKIKLNSEYFYAVGINSPIAQQLLNKTTGEKVIFNGNKIEILEVK